ncbi:hypothetical protein OF83DRAFT_1086043 [Amylostereum chailletii]|nr:hypothetical protein OF83DRAFT_1086043 [Amylostereum chailletii]
MSGQTLDTIALPLHRQNVNIFGTSLEMIDTAENRYKLSRLLDGIGIDQPLWKELTSFEEAEPRRSAIRSATPSWSGGLAINVASALELHMSGHVLSVPPPLIIRMGSG